MLRGELVSPYKPITTQEVARELNVNHSTVIWHLKQIGKVKKVSNWVPHELTVSISALLTIPKPLTVWITTNCGKFLKRWEYKTT